MSIAVFLSRITGLIREQAIAAFFGAGNITDAYLVAFRIPNLLRDLFAEGALSSAFVPAFQSVKQRRGIAFAWRTAKIVIRFFGVLVSALALVGIYFSEELVNLYASSFKQVPGKFELTVGLTKVIFPFFPCVVLAAIFMGALNACGIFFWPAFASALFNIVSVTSGIGLAFAFKYFEAPIEPIYGLAIGIVLGGAVQALCQLPELFRQGYAQTQADPPEKWHRDAGFRQTLRTVLPGMFGLASTQINILINSIFATSLGPGAVSWLGFSFRLMQFPIGIFGVSFASASTATTADLWARGQHENAVKLIEKSLLRVLSINVPASFGLAVLSVPICQLIFQYGKFTYEDTKATALALVGYSIGLASYSMTKVIVPFFYIQQRSSLPVMVSFITVALNLVFNIVLTPILGFYGLALGTSLASLTSALLLLVLLRRTVQNSGVRIDLGGIFRRAAGILCHSSLMAIACYSFSASLRANFALEAENPPFLFRIVETFSSVTVGIGVLYGTSILTRNTDLKEIFNFVISKIRKRMSN